MRKTKPTVAGLTRLYEGLQKEFEKYRLAAKNYAYELRNPSSRTLLTVEASDVQGRLNGLTVVELLAIVNMSKLSGERVFLTASDKKIILHAEKNPKPRPMEVY